MGVNVTDRNAARAAPLAAPNPLFLRDEELTSGLELLDFAHRALMAEADRLVGRFDLARHHRRILYFVGRQPGITMAALIEILQMSKQSLSRLIKELVAKDLVGRTPDEQDRRQWLLTLTEPGRELDRELNRRLRRRLASAYRAAGVEAVAGYHQVLLGLVDEPERRHLSGTR
jgi:DNA-binding MarR family transcriptional regulator